MTLPEAIGLQLPRRRANTANWDTPDEFLMYVVTDIIATDWEVHFPNGRIIDDFEYALTYNKELAPYLVPPIRVLKGTDSGSSGSA